MEFNTTQLLLALAALAVFAGVLIGLFRGWLALGSRRILTRPGAEVDRTVFPSERSKYRAVNAFQFSTPFLMLGFILSLAMVLVVFNWTQYEPPVDLERETVSIEEEGEVVPPITRPPAPPPPPPPSEIIEPQPDLEPIDRREEFIELDLLDHRVDDEKPDQSPVDYSLPPPVPPPIMDRDDPDDIMIAAEQMPRFPGCEEMAGTSEEKKACADQKLLEYIYRNVRFTAAARANGIEGMVVVSFVVDRNGTIRDAEILRDPGGGLGEQALKVVEKMNEMDESWTPGMQAGRKVNVRYNLPVRFTLQ